MMDRHKLEGRVLGAMLIDDFVARTVSRKLKSEDFVDRRHAEIFSAIRDLAQAGSDVDAVTVSSRLAGDESGRHAALESLAPLLCEAPEPAVAMEYAEELRTRA
jgi:replicative DNA helicase